MDDGQWMMENELSLPMGKFIFVVHSSRLAESTKN